MQIEYNILFIENDYEWIDSIEEFLTDYLDEKWFTLKLQRSTTFPSTVSDFNAYDIIVVDFTLDNNETWDQAIKQIRQSGEVYTEILFYSSIWEHAIRQKLIELGGFDWVYCSDRKDDLRKNLIGLIYTTIRKSQDLNNLRGLVMAETSELDDYLIKINQELIEKGKVNEALIEKSHSKILEYANAKKEKIETSKLIQLLREKEISAYPSWLMLQSFCKCDLNNLEWASISNYAKEIIDMRNLLAHNPEDTSTKNRMCILNNKWEPVVFTEEVFSTIRKNIRQHKETLINMHKNL